MNVLPSAPYAATYEAKMVIKGFAIFRVKNKDLLYRGYYMAAWRYEISLLVLKNISRVSAANG